MRNQRGARCAGSPVGVRNRGYSAVAHPTIREVALSMLSHRSRSSPVAVNAVEEGSDPAGQMPGEVIRILDAQVCESACNLEAMGPTT